MRFLSAPICTIRLWRATNCSFVFQWAVALWSGQGDGLELRLRYAEARILPTVSYRNAFIEVPLNSQRKVVVERQAVIAERLVASTEWRQFDAELAMRGSGSDQHRLAALAGDAAL